MKNEVKMFDSMTIDELEGKELDLELDIAEIQGQLDIDEADTDSPRDGIWRARATQALRYKKIQLRQAQYILAKKRRHSRATKRFESAFVELARKRLKPEIYRALVREASEAIELKKVA